MSRMAMRAAVICSEKKYFKCGMSEMRREGVGGRTSLYVPLRVAVTCCGAHARLDGGQGVVGVFR